jgi:hypothetical protein
MSVARYRALPTEDEMERTIREAVELLGGRCWHVRDSRRLDVQDMPDLLIVLPPFVALLELKSQRRKVTPGQESVLQLLERCHIVTSGIVRPVPKEGEMSLDEALELMVHQVSIDREAGERGDGMSGGSWG